jgi:hypothetical protein
MGTLDDLGLKYDADKSSRFHNYLDFYESVLPDRSFSGRLLEIGVMDGVSMKMWRDYYPLAEIVGIDIKDMSFMHNSDWKVPDSVTLITCDGTDPEVAAQLGMFDIILDDGSHMWSQQQASFEIFYRNNLNPGGTYILEDLWSSYIPLYYGDAAVPTVQYLEELREQGLGMTFFHHAHAGIQIVFPGAIGLDTLGSTTVAIPAVSGNGA